MTLDDATLQRWSEMAAKATPGPWHHNGFGDVVRGDRAVAQYAYGDAAFIAEARTALPACVDEIRRLRASNDALRQRLDEYKEPE